MTTKQKPKRKTKQLPQLPKVQKRKGKHEPGTFPLPYYSYSSLVKFATNPILFKIRYINHDHLDTATSAAFVLGQSFHAAMEVYYGGGDTPASSEEEAIGMALEVGMNYAAKYPDGFINWTTQIPNRQTLFDKLSFAFNEYIKMHPYDAEETLSVEEEIELSVDVEWRGERLALPIPLKCYTDRLVMSDGKLKIRDYKVTQKFSDPDRIDAKKIIQAVQYYFAVYAKHGVEPYSMIFEEVKHTKNRDGSPQHQEYEMVYAENEQFFDFYLRLYDDVTRAINGEMVWVPNFDAFYDNEIAIIAYIHRLDQEDERAKQMKKARVENITDLLKKKVQQAGNMERFLKTVQEQFVAAKHIDYSKMKPQEKIRMKLMEHGMVLDFDSINEGAAVDLYRFNPSVGLKMDRLKSYVADVEQVLGISGIRILAPILNSTQVGIEVPRAERVFYGKAPKANGLTFPVGIDSTGNIQTINLLDAPHILIGGATGGGKSVVLLSMLHSIKGNSELWLADPKGVELSHVKCDRYAEEPSEIRTMLEDLVSEMDMRYAYMKSKKLRVYDGRPIVCVIDEFGDFILQNPAGKEIPNYYSWTKSRLLKEVLKRHPNLYTEDETKSDLAGNLTMEDENKATKYMELNAEELVVKLAQKARAAGIHLVVATQNPKVQVITGLIKANFPTRIALRTTSEVESKVILDRLGAEKLLGKGDMLVLRSGELEPVRVQGYNI